VKRFKQPDATSQSSDSALRVLAEVARGFLHLRFQYNDPLTAQRARGLIRVCVVTALVAFVGLIYLLATFSVGQAHDLIAATALIGGMLGIGLAIVLVQGGREPAAGVVLVIVVTIGTSIALFPFGYNNVGALILSIPLVLSGMLFGLSGALIVFGILLVTLLASTFALNSQLMVPVALFTPSATPWGIIVTGGLVLGPMHLFCRRSRVPRLG